MFIIEDLIHAEPQEGEFDTFESALKELQRRASIPWNQAPNRCPCTSWETCGRKYQVIEYDSSSLPWTELGRIQILDISAQGIEWKIEKYPGSTANDTIGTDYQQE